MTWGETGQAKLLIYTQAEPQSSQSGHEEDQQTACNPGTRHAESCNNLQVEKQCATGTSCNHTFGRSKLLKRPEEMTLSRRGTSQSGLHVGGSGQTTVRLQLAASRKRILTTIRPLICLEMMQGGDNTSLKLSTKLFSLSNLLGRVSLPPYRGRIQSGAATWSVAVVFMYHRWLMWANACMLH